MYKQFLFFFTAETERIQKHQETGAVRNETKALCSEVTDLKTQVKELQDWAKKFSANKNKTISQLKRNQGDIGNRLRHLEN